MGRGGYKQVGGIGSRDLKYPSKCIVSRSMIHMVLLPLRHLRSNLISIITFFGEAEGTKYITFTSYAN